MKKKWKNAINLKKVEKKIKRRRKKNDKSDNIKKFNCKNQAFFL